MQKIAEYTHTKQMKEIGLSSRQIQNLVEQGQLLKLKQGLYRNADMFLQDQSFLDVCYAIPYAVITGFSALAYYGLTTHIPQDVSIAIPKARKVSKMIYPPVSVIRQDISKFKRNIVKVKRGKYSFNIYDMEKVVCDTIKNRNKMGTDTMKEVLREYLKRKDKDMLKLYETARECHVFDKLDEILTVMR